MVSVASLIFIFGLLGNITTGLVYLSPAKTFWHIVKKRSTEDFESIPYTCKLLNAYQWVYYGLTKPNSLLVATVNCFGAAAEIVYVALFLVFASSPRIRATTAIQFGLWDVAFPAAEFLAMQFVLQGETRISVAGLMCICFSMVAYASPLSAMKTVITTKSVEFMPFFLSFSLFVNGGIWTTYAFLTRDYFVGVPNGTGFLLGTAQLVLYVMYSSCTTSKKIPNNLEEGCQHERLLQASAPVAEEFVQKLNEVLEIS